MVAVLRDACLGVIYHAIPDSKPVFDDKRKYLAKLGIKPAETTISKESYIKQRSGWIYLFTVSSNSKVLLHLFVAVLLYDMFVFYTVNSYIVIKKLVELIPIFIVFVIIQSLFYNFCQHSLALFFMLLSSSSFFAGFFFGFFIPRLCFVLFLLFF